MWAYLVMISCLALPVVVSQTPLPACPNQPVDGEDDALYYVSWYDGSGCAGSYFYAPQCSPDESIVLSEASDPSHSASIVLHQQRIVYQHGSWDMPDPGCIQNAYQHVVLQMNFLVYGKAPPTPNDAGNLRDGSWSDLSSAEKSLIVGPPLVIGLFVLVGLLFIMYRSLQSLEGTEHGGNHNHNDNHNHNRTETDSDTDTGSTRGSAERVIIYVILLAVIGCNVSMLVRDRFTTVSIYNGRVDTHYDPVHQRYSNTTHARSPDDILLFGLSNVHMESHLTPANDRLPQPELPYYQQLALLLLDGRGQVLYFQWRALAVICIIALVLNIVILAFMGVTMYRKPVQWFSSYTRYVVLLCVLLQSSVPLWWCIIHVMFLNSSAFTTQYGVHYIEMGESWILSIAVACVVVVAWGALITTHVQHKRRSMEEVTRPMLSHAI